tara:strand:+ start:10363 stop:10518 length:156 start_codon:yes stop_codon:yes gene_type:complete
MTEPSKTWNIVFPFRLITRIREIASKKNITAASVVREAAERYVEEVEGKKK